MQLSEIVSKSRSSAFWRLLAFLVLQLSALPSWACQCPMTTLSLEECSKYDIIFKGRLLSVKDCDHKFGEALFEVQELYKGNTTEKFIVLFECHVECAMKLNAGEEWIIYTNYKQVDKGMMDWCSRSRKHFSNDKEDFYAVNYGNDYYDEEKFLREKLGLHRFLAEKITAEDNRNTRPSNTQMVVILICSLTAVVLFYWVFKRFVK